MGKILVLLPLALGMVPAAAGAADGAPSPEMVLEWLRYGNQRHAEGKPVHWHQSVARRREVAKTQPAQAVVIACSESTTPPEILFDQGLGDLYVLRAPGNVVGEREIAAVEMAVERHGVRVVVVLGHQGCSVVGHAVRGAMGPGHIGTLVAPMAAPVARVKGQPGDVLERAIHANVEAGVAALAASDPILAPLAGGGRLRVVGAYYDGESGRVGWMTPPAHRTTLSSGLPH
ncbi:MAG: carbonic anhydrase [Bryobacteraceae bacterium]